MTKRKVMFAALLILPVLGIVGLLFMYRNLDLCFYCFHKEDLFSLKYNYKRNSFLMVPEANCTDDPPFLVLLVTSAHYQREVRNAIRKTWGKERLIDGKRVVTFFLMGTSIGPSRDEVRLSEEVTTYKDIIQKDFVDHYYNLTMKTLMGVDWVTHYCPQTSYIMKTDTDMFVNTGYLVELLIRKNKTSNLFTGFLMIDYSPIRDKFSKWHVSESEYESNRYPPFCSGTGYVFSVDVAQKVYSSSYAVPFFKLEDVFMGMCLEKSNVSLQGLHSHQVFFVSKPSFSVCTYRKLVTSHGVSPAEIIRYWEALEKAQEERC